MVRCSIIKFVYKEVKKWKLLNYVKKNKKKTWNKTKKIEVKKWKLLNYVKKSNKKLKKIKKTHLFLTNQLYKILGNLFVNNLVKMN